MNIVPIVESRDDDMLSVALLHDTLEDTATTNDDIQKEFGPAICKISR